MEASQRNAKALNERIAKLTSSLVRHFENIVELAAAPENPDYSTTAHNAYQMDIETAALTRAAEGILTLTRQLQETWLFGQLDTLGRGRGTEQAKVEEEARAVAGLLEKLVGLMDQSKGEGTAEGLMTEEEGKT